jgi:hypothetical protein
VAECYIVSPKRHPTWIRWQKKRKKEGQGWRKQSWQSASVLVLQRRARLVFAVVVLIANVGGESSLLRRAIVGMMTTMAVLAMEDRSSYYQY